MRAMFRRPRSHRDGLSRPVDVSYLGKQSSSDNAYPKARSVTLQEIPGAEFSQSQDYAFL
jgi:hypothetical protein